ncbi:MAG: DUF4349 domain-containing protein [Ferruginibacter sp.]|nr:DUF4349 domain-containing protein [Cytophagales bacterium]
MRPFVLLALFSFVLPACNQAGPSHFQGGNPENSENTASAPAARTAAKEKQSADSESASLVLSNAPPSASLVANPSLAQDKIATQIIKHANVRFQVAELAKSMQAVGQAVKGAGGYVSSSEEARGNGELSANVAIRVPYDQFEKLLDDLVRQSTFLNTKSITSEDVTEQFVDIQTRLKTKKEAEQRYREILKQARTVKEVLEVEEQLRTIREEVEAQEGRLKFLGDQVRYSTIRLEMYQPIAYQSEPEIGFLSQLFRGIGQGWSGFLTFVVGLVSIWPFLLLLAGGGWLVRRWLGNRRVSA